MGVSAHVPGSEPDEAWTFAGAHTAGMPWIPEVEAVCGKAARTDLCGGRGVIPVPTATEANAGRGMESYGPQMSLRYIRAALAT